MAVKKVSEIIGMSQTMHNALQKILREAISSVDDTRLSGALEYLESVEQKTKDMIEEMPEHDRKNMLDTFIRYYPVDEEDEAQLALENIDSDDIEQLMGGMVKVRQKIVDIYDFCGTEAHIPELQDLMKSIRDFEATKLHDISRQLSEFQLQR
jgi:hypothetical protein